ncbi:cyclic AMP-responsive element-binding protein 5 isoform X1 [Takifugu flavidus]|uniref:cyclic AMP-responsive element-binding protein 5 isoform X1 n=1 Tax=Takifugu flavidus TaxID=433684 RepID=UPI0025442BDF|nr:cyclic AMP-responsive element-binding protein 5 isoform X1 [Takifugu flavidus]XP_056875963.1 cyclic AMP-responsive element-binding protein 5 isoform X1 [Takifugu flavidus]XP_056875964.1 cyclic AMP-responsive element-binding protein 5 isoform X1 [Takifugu flavidus]XP_056875965.1 cyclic AMP-responsive element-binding protein 5 isoform X1 [Takifugu flavidus]
MNDKQDRPYVCSAPGCSQRFQSEEHLLIHRHKHEMTLKFSSIKTDAAFTDQTPTPTRFLQNCEEVGLFKEIEEEFLQEQEEEKNKEILSHNGRSCMTQHAHPQPQLHHPHTLPLQHPQSHGSMMGPSCSHNPQHVLSSSLERLVVTQTSSTLTHSGPVPGSLSSLLHMQNRHRQPLPASLPGTLPDPAMQGASAQHMVRSNQTLGHHFHQHHPGMVINNPVKSVGHVMDTMALRHSAPLLQSQQRPPHHHHQQQHSQFPAPNFYQQQVHTPPQQLGGAHSRQLHQSIGVPHTQVHRSPPPHLRQSSPPVPPQLSPVKHQIHPLHPGNSQHAVQASGSCNSAAVGGVGRRRRIVEQDPDERRQKFLERNRAAATRCRQKRKLWVSSLERKAEELTHTNLQLQNEVTALRTEVGQLKQILLTHKDCPVTARQRDTQVYPNYYKPAHHKEDRASVCCRAEPRRKSHPCRCWVSVACHPTQQHFHLLNIKGQHWS